MPFPPDFLRVRFRPVRLFRVFRSLPHRRAGGRAFRTILLRRMARTVGGGAFADEGVDSPPLAGRGDLRMYLQVKPICVSEKIINIFRNFYCYSFHKNKSFSTFVPSDSAHTEVRRATLEREWISN